MSIARSEATKQSRLASLLRCCAVALSFCCAMFTLSLSKGPGLRPVPRFIFLLAQENEPKEGHPRKSPGAPLWAASGKPIQTRPLRGLKHESLLNPPASLLSAEIFEGGIRKFLHCDVLPVIARSEATKQSLFTGRSPDPLDPSNPRPLPFPALLLCFYCLQAEIRRPEFILKV